MLKKPFHALSELRHWHRHGNGWSPARSDRVDSLGSGETEQRDLVRRRCRMLFRRLLEQTRFAAQEVLPLPRKS